MQYQVVIAVRDAEDLFDLVDQLKSLKDLPGVKVGQATPRPEPTQQIQTQGQPQGILGIPPGTTVTAPVPEGTKPINMKTGQPVEQTKL